MPSPTIFYTLDDDNRAVPATLEEYAVWARSFQTKGDDRLRFSVHVGDTAVGEVRVSTVFLAIDHNWGSGPPVLWETMVFGGPLDQEQIRYRSHDAAVVGHKVMVKRVEKAQ